MSRNLWILLGVTCILISTNEARHLRSVLQSNTVAEGHWKPNPRGNGFQLAVHHRDSQASPYRRAFASNQEMFGTWISEDRGRFKKMTGKAQGSDASSSSDASFSSATLGATSGVAVTGSGVSTVGLNQTIESAFVRGNVGTYYVEIFLGTPAVRQTAIFDTGSNLIWVQCECLDDNSCYDQVSPFYETSNSSTYAPVPCGSSFCRDGVSSGEFSRITVVDYYDTADADSEGEDSFDAPPLPAKRRLLYAPGNAADSLPSLAQASSTDLSASSKQSRPSRSLLQASASSDFSNPFSLCDFFFEGFESSVPTFELGRPDYGFSRTVMDAITGAAVQVANSGEGFFLCEGEGDNTDSSVIGNQFYVQGQPGKLATRAFNQPNGTFFENRFIQLFLNSAQIFDGITVTNLNPGDGNPEYPQDRRCLLFETGPNPPSSSSCPDPSTPGPSSSPLPDPPAPSPLPANSPPPSPSPSPTPLPASSPPPSPSPSPSPTPLPVSSPPLSLSPPPVSSPSPLPSPSLPPSPPLSEAAQAIVDALLAAGIFDTTLELLVDNGLIEVLARLTDVTLFAPTDLAWDALSTQPGSQELTEILNGPRRETAVVNLLLYHVVTDYLTLMDLLELPAPFELSPILDSPLFITPTDVQVSFFFDLSDPQTNVNIDSSDVLANGLIAIQGITGVLIPSNLSVLLEPVPNLGPDPAPSPNTSPSLPAPDTPPSASPTPSVSEDDWLAAIRAALIEAGAFGNSLQLLADTGLEGTLAGMTGVTLLAPTNVAWVTYLSQPGGRELLEVLSGPSGETATVNLLLYHMVTGYLTFTDLAALPPNSPLFPLLEDPLYSTSVEGEVFFFFDLSDPSNNVTLDTPEVYLDGEISIQGINGVLIPPDLNALLEPVLGITPPTLGPASSPIPSAPFPPSSSPLSEPVPSPIPSAPFPPSSSPLSEPVPPPIPSAPFPSSSSPLSEPVPSPIPASAPSVPSSLPPSDASALSPDSAAAPSPSSDTESNDQAMSIADALSLAGDFDTTLQLLVDNRLADPLAGWMDVTLFAPTDSAWAGLTSQPGGQELSEVLNGPRGETAVVNLLLYHAVNGYLTFRSLDELSFDALLFPTLESPLYARSSNGAVYLFPSPADPSNNATLVTPDIYDSGEISIQGINGVLIPANLSLLLQPVPDLAGSSNEELPAPAPGSSFPDPTASSPLPDVPSPSPPPADNTVTSPSISAPESLPSASPPSSQLSAPPPPSNPSSDDYYECSGLCGYQYRYGSGATEGVLSTETFSFTQTDGSTLALDNTVFGCSFNSTGFKYTDGLLGMGRSYLSLPSQFAASAYKDYHLNIFSICLVRNQLEEASTVSYGQLAVPADGVGYTPMITDLPDSQPGNDIYYYVQVENVTVGGQLADIPASTWDAESGAQGGTFLDTGFTYTALLPEARSAIFSLVTELAPVSEVGNPTVGTSTGDFTPCYDLSDFVGTNLNEVFPVITFSFAGNATLEVLPYQYLVSVEGATYCGNVDTEDINVIGNTFMQNNIIVWDNVNSRIGIKPTNCETGEPL